MSEESVDQTVVDASIALKWVLDEPYTAEARALLGAWTVRRLRLLAPGWFACEVANALYQRVRRGQLTPRSARLGLRGILEQVILRDAEPDTAERALQLALQLGRATTYDTQYAALAEREGAELWTADERFWHSARGHLPWVRWIGER